MVFSKEVKSPFPSCMAHRAALISVPLALQPGTSLHCKTADTGPVHRVYRTHIHDVSHLKTRLVEEWQKFDH